jgi:hypothetical protein
VKTLVVFGVLMLLAIPAFAADISGKWVAQVPGRGGEPMETTFTFKAAGEKLTGAVTTPMGDLEISEGKVSGEEVSFATVLPFGDGSMKFVYTGKLAGAEIKFKRELKGAPEGPPPGGGQGGGRGGMFGPVEFTAKKA